MKIHVFMEHEVLAFGFRRLGQPHLQERQSLFTLCSTQRHNPGDWYLHQDSYVNLESPKTEAG
jgi:hypothetical protein